MKLITMGRDIMDRDDPLDQIDQISDDEEDSLSKIKTSVSRIEKNQKNLARTIKIKLTVTTGIIAVIVLIIGIVMTQIILPNESFEDSGILNDDITSSYVIENLKGETVHTWVAWKIVEGDFFHIHVNESPEVTQERLDVINDVIYSDEVIEHEGQKYYKGWQGALKSIEQDTEFPIPIHHHTATTDDGVGHIVITLTNLKNGDGYTGYTKSQIDETNNQILKSHITIYNVDELSNEDLRTITRHELGHAFGLAHSDHPDSLMYPVIETNFPYIEQCMIDGITELYDGNEKGTIVCEN